jgi:hypothetical protein
VHGLGKLKRRSPLVKFYGSTFLHDAGAKDVIDKIGNERQLQITKGLNDLIEKKILVIKPAGWVITRCSVSDSIEFKENVRLELFNKEYIKRIEDENNSLRELIRKLKEVTP